MEMALIAAVVVVLAAVVAVAVLATRLGDRHRRVVEGEARETALTTRLDAAQAAQRAAEQDLALARQQLTESERRAGDFERLRQESLHEAKAAVLATAQQLSSKLLEDHKRETVAAREETETRVRKTAEGLVKQVDAVVQAVAALQGQVEEKSRTLDTVWRALSSPGGAGQLAEIGLANTLKSFGLEQGRDYVLQLTTQDEVSGRVLRPDAVVFLPGDSRLVIDCKASKFLVEIAAAEGSEGEEEAYHNLARTMNLHLKALASKDYRGAVQATTRAEGRSGATTRIFSLMYLPNEAALEKLNRADPDFLRKAREAQIIPAGPAGLYCALSVAAMEINTLRQIDGQQRIADTAKALLEGIVVALGFAANVGKSLKTASDNFAKFTGSVNQRLLPRARRLTQLGIQPSGKALPPNLPSYAVTTFENDTLIEGEAADVVEETPPAPPQLIAE